MAGLQCIGALLVGWVLIAATAVAKLLGPVAVNQAIVGD